MAKETNWKKINQISQETDVNYDWDYYYYPRSRDLSKENKRMDSDLELILTGIILIIFSIIT